LHGTGGAGNVAQVRNTGHILRCCQRRMHDQWRTRTCVRPRAQRRLCFQSSLIVGGTCIQTIALGS
jgi:hypothetical protein